MDRRADGVKFAGAFPMNFMTMSELLPRIKNALLR